MQDAQTYLYYYYLLLYSCLFCFFLFFVYFFVSLKNAFCYAIRCLHAHCNYRAFLLTIGKNGKSSMTRYQVFKVWMPLAHLDSMFCQLFLQTLYAWILDNLVMVLETKLDYFLELVILANSYLLLSKASRILEFYFQLIFGFVLMLIAYLGVIY